MEEGLWDGFGEFFVFLVRILRVMMVCGDDESMPGNS